MPIERQNAIIGGALKASGCAAAVALDAFHVGPPSPPSSLERPISTRSRITFQRSNNNSKLNNSKLRSGASSKHAISRVFAKTLTANLSPIGDKIGTRLFQNLGLGALSKTVGGCERIASRRGICDNCS
jgi:hypothetical protein